MNYVVIYGERNIQYGFKAANDEAALEFCKSYFSVPTSQMVIVEYFSRSMPSEFGRVVFANNNFLRYSDEETREADEKQFRENLQKMREALKR